MVRTCARPGCNASAEATFNFDGERRIVWLGPLDVASGRSAGDLCATHADRLRPPRHWELHDQRVGGGADVTPLPAGAPTTPLLARAFRAAKAG